MEKQKKQSDFSQSKLYMIWCNVTGKFYIGSTTLTLEKRKQNHNYSYNKWLKNKIKYDYIASFEIIKNNNCAIILLEEFPCKNKKELLTREQYWIDYHNGCLNQNKAIITLEQEKEYFHNYNMNRKDATKEYNKQYNETYKEELKKQRMDYYYRTRDVRLEKMKESYQKKKLQTTNIISVI
jgi:hypothetical protein